MIYIFFTSALLFSKSLFFVFNFYFAPSILFSRLESSKMRTLALSCWFSSQLASFHGASIQNPVTVTLAKSQSSSDHF